MIESIGHHGFDDGDVIDHRSKMRQKLRDFRPAFALFGKLEFRPQELGVGRDKGSAIAFDEFGRRQLPIELGQLRFVVKHLQMAGSTGHEQIYDSLGFGGKGRLLRRKRVDRFIDGVALLSKQVRDGQCAEAKRSHAGTSVERSDGDCEEDGSCYFVSKTSGFEVNPPRLRVGLTRLACGSG